MAETNNEEKLSEAQKLENECKAYWGKKGEADSILPSLDVMKKAYENFPDFQLPGKASVYDISTINDLYNYLSGIDSKYKDYLDNRKKEQTGKTFFGYYYKGDDGGSAICTGSFSQGLSN